MLHHNLPITLSIQLNIHSCYVMLLINFEYDTVETTYRRKEIYCKIQEDNEKSV